MQYEYDYEDREPAIEDWTLVTLDDLDKQTEMQEAA
jgi:hypothetical protein